MVEKLQLMINFAREEQKEHNDIKFPKEFAKVCGEHASLFKCEITVLVRTVPLQVNFHMK